MYVQVGKLKTKTLNFELHGPNISPPTIVSPSSDSSVPFSVRMEGNNFGSKSEYGCVYLGSEKCVTLEWKNNEIIANCTTRVGSLYVMSRGQESNQRQFDYDQIVQESVIISIIATKKSTRGGDEMTITATNFGNNPKVLMGNEQCVVVQHHGAQIVALTVAGEGSVDVRIDNGWRLSNPKSFVYDGPIVTSITPTNLPTIGGDVISIVGDNFGFHAFVSVGGSPCDLLTHNHTYMECTLPPGQGGKQLVNIRVTDKSTQYTYNYHSPTLLSMNPESGVTRGKYLMTLIGTNFGVMPKVVFGGDEQSSGLFGSVDVVHHEVLANETMMDIDGKKFWVPMEEVNFVMSEGGGSRVSVFVQSLDQVSNPLTFKFSSPQIESVYPACIKTDGSQAISIIGNNFGNSSMDKTYVLTSMEDKKLEVDWLVEHEQVELKVSGRGSHHSVLVQVVDQFSNEASMSFCGPTLLAVSPSYVGAVLGNKITLRGDNFGGKVEGFHINVGDYDCGNIVFDENSPHSVVYCELKPPSQSGFMTGSYSVLVRVLDRNSSIEDMKLDVMCEVGE